MQVSRTLDLKKLPFSRAGSRFLIMEKTGEDCGLYVSISSSSVSMFGGSGDPHEVLKIELMKDGADVPYTVIPTPYGVELNNEFGYVRFAIDKYNLLIEAHGLQVHFSAKKGGAFLCDSIKMTVDGALIPIKGVKMTFVQTVGTQVLNAPWDTNIRGSSNPDLYLYPDDTGTIKCAIVDQSTSEEEYFPDISVDKCIEETEKDFEKFYAGLKLLPAVFGDSFEYAYAIWTGLQPMPDKNAAYCTNIISPIQYIYHEQAVVSLACKDVDFALAAICNFRPYLLKSGAVAGSNGANGPIYECDIPLLGLAAYNISNEALKAASPELLNKAYDMLAGRAKWWAANRTDANGHYMYAFRSESGHPADICFDAGEPVITPDLSAYMVLLFAALEKFAAAIGNTESAAKWQAKAEEQLAVLKSLWNGSEFIAQTVGGATVKCGLLAKRPVILGALMPSDIASVFCPTPECDDVIEACLLIKGLYDLGHKKYAADAAQKIINDFITKGNANSFAVGDIYDGAYYSAITCAALLYLGTALDI